MGITMDSKNFVILALCAVAISALPNSIVPEAPFDETDSTPQSELGQSVKTRSQETNKKGSSPATKTENCQKDCQNAEHHEACMNVCQEHFHNTAFVQDKS